MFSASAAKGDHQALEAAVLVAAHAGVHQRCGVSQKLAYAVLLDQVLDDRRVFARKVPESLFAAGVGETAGIEDEPAAMPRIVCRRLLVKGKTEDLDGEIFRIRGSHAPQFF